MSGTITLLFAVNEVLKEQSGHAFESWITAPFHLEEPTDAMFNFCTQYYVYPLSQKVTDEANQMSELAGAKQQGEDKVRLAQAQFSFAILNKSCVFLAAPV